MNKKLSTCLTLTYFLMLSCAPELGAETLTASNGTEQQGIGILIPLWAELGLLFFGIAIVYLMASHRVPDGSMFTDKKWKENRKTKSRRGMEQDNAVAH
jgi:hypothetical protein